MQQPLWGDFRLWLPLIEREQLRIRERELIIEMQLHCSDTDSYRNAAIEHSRIADQLLAARR